MKHVWLYAFLLIATFTSYAQKSLTTKTKKTITLEVKTMFDNCHNDIVKNGLKAELKYLDASSDFFWVPPSYNTALNYNAVKKILLSNSKSISYIEFSWETIEIFPITNKIANYSGIVKVVEINTANKHMAFRILESGTLIKRKDGWKFLSGQSRNLPSSSN